MSSSILNIYNLNNFKLDNNINIKFEIINEINNKDYINLYINNKYDNINKYKSYIKNKKIDITDILINFKYKKIAILYKLDNISISVNTKQTYESFIINNFIYIYDNCFYIKLNFLKKHNINKKGIIYITIISIPEKINYSICNVLDKYLDNNNIYMSNILYLLINDIKVEDKKNILQNKYELPIYSINKIDNCGSILFYNYHVNNKFILIPVKLFDNNTRTTIILSQYKECKCYEYKIYKNLIINKIDKNYKENEDNNNDYSNNKYTLLEYNINKCYHKIYEIYENEFIDKIYIKISDIKKKINITSKFINIYKKKRYIY